MQVKADQTKSVAFVSTGGMLEVASTVHDKLLELGIDSSIYSVHTIKPIDEQKIIEIFCSYDFVFSLEEHSIVGGLSSAMLECLPGRYDGRINHFHPIALPSIFTSLVGDQKYLRQRYGLSPDLIYKKVLETINLKK